MLIHPNAAKRLGEGLTVLAGSLVALGTAAIAGSIVNAVAGLGKISAAMRLLLSPTMLLIAVLGALAYALYENRAAIRVWFENNPLLGRAAIGAGAVTRIALLAARFSFLRTAIAGVIGLMARLSALLLVNPWIALAAGLAVAAVEIYRNWDSIIAYSQSKIAELQAAMQPLKSWFDESMKPVDSWLKDGGKWL